MPAADALHNILKAQDNNNYCIRVDASSQAGLQSDFNDVYATNGAFTGYWGDERIQTLVDWQAATTQDAASIDSDPLFQAEAEDLFSLKPTSPCIDSGMTIEIVVDDFDGTERPLGDAYDMGAFEQATGGVCFLGIL